MYVQILPNHATYISGVDIPPKCTELEFLKRLWGLGTEEE